MGHKRKGKDKKNDKEKKNNKDKKNNLKEEPSSLNTNMAQLTEICQILAKINDVLIKEDPSAAMDKGKGKQTLSDKGQGSGLTPDKGKDEGQGKSVLTPNKGKDEGQGKSVLTPNKGKEKQLASDSSLDVTYEQGFTKEILDGVISCKTPEEGMRFLKSILHLSKPDAASIRNVLLEDKAALDATKHSTMVNEEHASEPHTLNMAYEKKFTQDILGRVLACNTKEDGMRFLKTILNLEGPDTATTMEGLFDDNREAAIEATKHYTSNVQGIHNHLAGSSTTAGILGSGPPSNSDVLDVATKRVPISSYRLISGQRTMADVVKMSLASSKESVAKGAVEDDCHLTERPDESAARRDQRRESTSISNQNFRDDNDSYKNKNDETVQRETFEHNQTKDPPAFVDTNLQELSIENDELEPSVKELLEALQIASVSEPQLNRQAINHPYSQPMVLSRNDGNMMNSRYGYEDFSQVSRHFPLFEHQNGNSNIWTWTPQERLNHPGSNYLSLYSDHQNQQSQSVRHSQQQQQEEEQDQFYREIGYATERRGDPSNQTQQQQWPSNNN